VARRARKASHDERLTLVEHLDELRIRLILSLSVLAIGIAVCYVEQHRIYHALRAPIHYRQLVALGPTEAFFNTITISVYGGVLLTLPVLSYQVYAYLIPAFAPDSQRTIRPLIVMAPVLFILGAIFGWFVVVPPALRFLTSFNSQDFHYLPQAAPYIRFVTLTVIAMGVVFELPVVMMILGRVGIITSHLMKRRWREAIVILAAFAALLPGTDPITMLAEYLPMLALYGLSYFLVKAVEPHPTTPPNLTKSATLT
jgi:sec-independent protein translocase protein TatC